MSYDPEVIERVYREEHFYITKIDRFKDPVSKGLIQALKWFIIRHETRAIDLNLLEDTNMNKAFNASRPAGFFTKRIMKKNKRRTNEHENKNIL